MSTRRDEVVAKAEEYIHKTWNLTILNQVGRGSSGIVFLAVDGSGIKHAVKIMWKNEFIVEYQERELAIYKTLNHKNIVQFYNGISLPDCVIIEMEYCEIDLDIYVKKQGGFLSLRQFRSLARQMNAAVHYLHSQGIAHRDIKPANVWLKILDDGEFVAKLGNFSFAKKEDDGLDTVLGTPLFEAPEVIRCRQNRNYTIKCDIWSLGVMYYNLLTGEFPFEFSHSYQGVRRAVCRSQLVPFAFPDHVNVPDCCGDFIWKHLFREPDLRFSAEEALSHPFLLNDIGDIIQVASPLGTSNCVKPLVCDIGVGDIVFDKARRVMGDTIREPHVSISGSLSTPITWGDIAHVFHFDDKEILDDICIISDGSIFTSDDVIPCERFGSITALFISGKKGVVANCIEADHHSCIDEEELHKIQSLDSSSFACLES